MLILTIFGLAFTIIISEVAVLAQAFRVMQLVLMGASPGLLSAAALVEAIYIYILRDVTT